MFLIDRLSDGTTENEWLNSIADAIKSECYEEALQKLFQWPLVFTPREWYNRIQKSIIARLNERIWLRIVTALNDPSAFLAKLWYYLLSIHIEPRQAQAFYQQFLCGNCSVFMKFEAQKKPQLPKSFDDIGSEWRLTSGVYESPYNSDDDAVVRVLSPTKTPTRAGLAPHSAPEHLLLAPPVDPIGGAGSPAVPEFLQ